MLLSRNHLAGASVEGRGHAATSGTAHHWRTKGQVWGLMGVHGVCFLGLRLFGLNSLWEEHGLLFVRG